ncbi:MAG: toll/interleukin-1 receptor domain-containing protein, partial [Desulfobacterales bacterium]|nr:toll/interleukin-1 receptor domain-containing protein [Desulfobacterales bacterium]
PSSVRWVMVGSRQYMWSRNPPKFKQNRYIDEKLLPDEELLPVLLGVSAPRAVKPGKIFIARFVAYIKSLEEKVKQELSELSRQRSESYMGVGSCRWMLNTHVTVKLSGRYLKVNPSENDFMWNGERNMVNFMVKVLDDVPDAWTVLLYEVFIDGIRVAFIPLDLEITSNIKFNKRNIVAIESPHTAFASYASQDRLRVLDRVASVRISAGFDIFMDCLSIHPGEERKKRLESEIEKRDLFMLFWSKNAKKSRSVTWEWKTAIVKKEEKAIQLHHLQTETEASLPKQLKRFYVEDLLMIVRKVHDVDNPEVKTSDSPLEKVSKKLPKPKEHEKLGETKRFSISINEKIRQNNASIEQILDNWGFRPGHGKREEKKADIEKWLHRFSLSEFDDAFLILERIQYHDSHTVDGYIEGLSRELKKVLNDDLSEILFYPLGESPASSGSNLLYSYRKNLGLPETSFPYVPFKDIDLSGKKAIVFFDDIIGTGNQAVEFAEKHLHDIKIDIYYVALMAFEKGLENVRNNGCFKKVIVHEIISEDLKAFSPESQVFSDADTRKRIKILCEKYGKELYPKHPLGYDDSQALIVFPHNTPNNTLPIIWASDKNEKEPGYVWYPVWERIKRYEKTS